MEMMELTEIRRNPNVTNFVIKRNAGGDWNVFFMIDAEIHQVRTQRGKSRNFKTMDNAVRFVEECGKTDRVTVMINTKG